MAEGVITVATKRACTGYGIYGYAVGPPLVSGLFTWGGGQIYSFPLCPCHAASSSLKEHSYGRVDEKLLSPHNRLEVLYITQK